LNRLGTFAREMINRLRQTHADAKRMTDQPHRFFELTFDDLPTPLFIETRQ